MNRFNVWSCIYSLEGKKQLGTLMFDDCADNRAEAKPHKRSPVYARASWAVLRLFDSWSWASIFDSMLKGCFCRSDTPLIARIAAWLPYRCKRLELYFISMPHRISLGHHWESKCSQGKSGTLCRPLLLGFYGALCSVHWRLYLFAPILRLFSHLHNRDSKTRPVMDSLTKRFSSFIVFPQTKQPSLIFTEVTSMPSIVSNSNVISTLIFF